MKSYQKAAVMAAFLAFFVFSGCIFDTTPTPETRAEGVTMSFDNNYLPNTVKSDTPFDIYINLINAGSYEIKPKELAISLFGGGYSLSGKEPWVNKEAIRGADTEEEFGDILYVDKFIGATFKGVPVEGTEVPFTVGASVCYTYKTSAVAQICLKSPKDSAPFCNDNDDKLKVLGVAPIAVTSVSQQSYSNSIDILIHVANKGSGKAYSIGDSSCSKQKEEDVITLEKFTLGGKDYTKDCDEIVRLSSYADVSFKCTVPLSTEATKEQSADILLSYKYANSITKTVYASA